MSFGSLPPIPPLQSWGVIYQDIVSRFDYKVPSRGASFMPQLCNGGKGGSEHNLQSMLPSRSTLKMGEWGAPKLTSKSV